MIRAALAALTLATALAGCGADGAPLPPPAKADPQPGITLGGEARMGIVTSQ